MRGTAFSVFEGSYTKMKETGVLSGVIPLTGGLEYRVVMAGVLAGIGRCVIDTPFEYAKVR